MTIHEELARQHRLDLQRAAHKPDTAPRSGAASWGELTPLVLAARAGDQRAWDALVGRLTPAVRAVVRGYRLDAADVEDVVQTTWLAAVTHLARIREPEAIGGWLLVTARREALRALQRRRRELPLEATDEADPDVRSAPEGALLARERGATLRGAVERLPERQRQLLHALNGGVAYADVSRRLDIPVGSIGPTRERALARLRGDRRLAALHAAA